ncbi:cAMP-dependent protein kinase [Aureococcus anophagefferens]|nr:cAMP-dependent protein kinase [Aureococcus anophagefferens]
MGEVTLAKFRKDGKFVALKAVSKGYVAKHNDERHVQNERAILTRLRHPFVVSLFGTFQDKKKVYFVMEFVAGGELFSKLRGNQCLTAPVARFYLAEILSALAYVHANGFAKPKNVVLDLDGHCRLIDFGFACAPPGGPDGLMRTNCGTPAYLSPEQLSRKKTGGYTRIVDWWAFGCVAHELMTGHTPFCKRGRVRRRFSRASATPPPLGKDHKEDSHYAIYLRVIKGRISFPSFLGATPKSLVKALLKAGKGRLVDAPSITGQFSAASTSPPSSSGACGRPRPRALRGRREPVRRCREQPCPETTRLVEVPRRLQEKAP